MTDKIQAALKAGYTPDEVLGLTDATKEQVNAHLDDVRASQYYINANHGRQILNIWPNL